MLHLCKNARPGSRHGVTISKARKPSLAGLCATVRPVDQGPTSPYTTRMSAIDAWPYKGDSRPPLLSVRLGRTDAGHRVILQRATCTAGMSTPLSCTSVKVKATRLRTWQIDRVEALLRPHRFHIGNPSLGIGAPRHST